LEEIVILVISINEGLKVYVFFSFEKFRIPVVGNQLFFNIFHIFLRLDSSRWAPPPPPPLLSTDGIEPTFSWARNEKLKEIFIL
jgi:hypothetical protein